MLEFYWITDVDDKWNEPREECYLNSFSLDEWRALWDSYPDLNCRDKGLCPEVFFEDVRFSEIDVALMSREIERYTTAVRLSNKTPPELAERAMDKLQCVLRQAVALGAGMMSFCD